MSDHALDYYYQGLRIQPRHFGCCFNVATIFLRKNKFKNAQKWFHMATKLDKESKVAYLGLAVSSLKLGQHQYCIQQIEKRPGVAKARYRKDKACSSNSAMTRTHRSSFADAANRTSEDVSSRSRSQSFSRSNKRNIVLSQNQDDMNYADKASNKSVNNSSRQSKMETISPGQSAAGARVDSDGPVLEQVQLDIEDQFTFLKAICFKRQAQF